ncbi:MAG TPA: O-antigen ligase family protein [Pyrinomonadaceae bacterium]|jgi:O-antigen ligase
MKYTDFFRKIDDLNDLATENRAARWLERAAFIFLTIMILFAPHSIAVTQSAWLLGTLASVLRVIFKPRPKFRLRALHYALGAFFLWSVVSSAFSYAPGVSLDKLRGVSLFLVFYFVYANLKTLRAARFLAFALIISATVAAAWMPIERIVGRGVEVHGLNAESPLLKARRIDEGLPISEGKTIVQVGRRKIYSPEGLVAEIEKRETSRLVVYHDDFYSTVEVNRTELLAGGTAAQRLGIADWKRNHSWRAAGFYGHFTTFAEVLQLILSLAFGIFVSVLTARLGKSKFELSDFKSPIFICLALAIALMAFALLLTVTRASQFAFFVSAAVIVLLGAPRRLALTFAAIALPLAIVGLVYYQQTRNIGFNLQDKSTQYRTMMWRDGARLFGANARNAVFGVGMDSIKLYWREWDLFDRGREPMGHFHSTLVQLAVERGLPALLIWLTVLGIYARTLRRHYKLQIANYKDKKESGIRNPKSEIERGIVLGCLGGLVGFFASGLVHYNLGDGEVATVFYILMGLGFFICNFAKDVLPKTETAR